MTKFQSITHDVLARGIDAHSTFNRISPGFSSDLINMDCEDRGALKKRTGYEGFLGDVPLRVESVTDNANGTATLNLDNEVNLLLTPSTPIVLYGDPLTAGTGTISSLGTALSGVGTAFTTELKAGSIVRAGGAERRIVEVLDDSTAVLDEAFYPDISGLPFTYRTLQQFYFPVFVNESKQELPAGSGPSTLTFGHNTGDILSPLMMARSDSETTLDNTKIFPEDVVFYDNGLDADITLDNSESSEAVQIYITSEDTDFTQQTVTYEADVTLAGATVHTFTIPVGTHGLPNLNIYPVMAYQNPANSSEYISFVPDEFVIEDDGDFRFSLTVQEDMLTAGECDIKLRLFDMGGEYAQESSFTAGLDKQIIFPDVDSAFNFSAFYLREAGDTEQRQVYPDGVVYNDALQQLEFTFSLSESGTLKAVYMPGIVKSNRVTIDSTGLDWLNDDLPQLVMWGIPNSEIVYRGSAARGGELTGLEEYSSASADYLVATGSGLLYKETTGEISLPAAEVDIRRRLAAGRVVGPFFSNEVTQTRRVGADNLSLNKLPLLSLTNNGDETITAALTISNKTGTLDDLVLGLDVAEITGAERPEYNGSWSVSTVDDSLNTITLSVPGLPSWVANETDTGAMLGIFSDVVSMSPTDDQGNTLPLPFLAEDIINSTLFEVSSPSVLFVSGTDMWLNGLTETASLPSGARLSADRTSDTIQVDDISQLVRGDIIEISGYRRKPRILQVDPEASTIQIDESLEVSDNAVSRTRINVPGRWITVESPDYNERKFIHWDTNNTTSQVGINSARINDSIFFSNYLDPVMKYDGEHVYRAGLPQWQLQSHSWVDGTETGIVVPKLSYLNVQHDGGTHTHIFFGELPDLTGVTTLYEATTATLLNIVSVNETERFIAVDGNVEGVIPDRGLVSIPQELGYYFKIQAVDRNNNVIASAVTDYEESIITVDRDGAVNHKLAGLAKFDLYDYDRLDVYMYRTRVGQEALPPFYLARRDSINYRYPEGEDVLILNDTTPDEALSPVPDDQVSIALKGAELPLSSEEPPRAKYMTSSDNRLVMGNIKSWNILDLDLLSNSGITEFNTMDGLLLDLSNGDSSVVVSGVPFLEWNINQYDALNTTNLREINSVEYPDSTTVRLTLTGSVGSSLLGEYIQLGSWFTDADASGIYESLGRTRTDTLGGLIGHWQVNSHTVDVNDTIELFFVHGRTTADNWTFGAGEAPLYLAHDAGRLPVVQVPYVLSGALGRTVTEVVYDDRKNQFEFTNAINRGLKDIRTALVSYMTRQTKPWLLVKAGATEGTGKIVFSAVRPQQTITGTLTRGASSDLQIFWNQRRTPSGDSQAGFERLFPSRLVVSTANYPEMFDNPYALSALYGDSIIDVNANDGQEIIGMSTFFSNSTTSAAQLEETLIVCKNKSVYAVNLNTRTAQKLDSGEQGCNLPGSVAATKDGIMFANTSGIYMVTKNLDIIYVGDWIENKWTQEVNFDVAADRAVSITDGLSRKYKLSLPLGSSVRNDHVAVFNYESAEELGGGWTFYDNMPASDWVQTNEGTYFSSYEGRVFRLRDTGEASDYRDDSSAIAASMTYAPQSFTPTGKRAILNRVVAHIEGTVTELQPSVAVDLESTFLDLDKVNVVNPLGDTVASSVPSRHATFFQVRYEHSTKDEGFTLGGLDFSVAGLDETGIKQAKNT